MIHYIFIIIFFRLKTKRKWTRGTENLGIKTIRKKKTEKLSDPLDNFITKNQHPTIPSIIAAIKNNVNP